MKEKLLALLQTKFPGVDNAILARFASKRVEGVTDDSQLPEVIEGIGFQDVLQSYGDYRAGDATVKAYSNYERKHNLKDGKPIERPTETGEQPNNLSNLPEEDFNAKMQAWLEKHVKPIQDELHLYKEKEAITTRTNLITQKAKELGIPDWRLNEGFAIAPDANESDITNYLAGVQKNLVTAGLKGGGGFPLAGTGEATKDDIEEILSGMKI